ncbi:helix-turn-helix domain-containing protein [Massilia niabensis]|uniref:Helix-turn-helix domain-containing protein n=1 Tax=Massilia niabensis TaxID=544910 RepID=A0ABW0L3N3_9BURK
MYPSCHGEPGDPVLTTREAARLLGIAVSTAQLWIENGVLPAWKTPGGHRRVRLSDVSALLRERAGLQSVAKSADISPQDPGALPGHERARLAAVQASGLLDSAPEAVFDRLAWLAGEVTGCPIALLTLVTAQRQWCKARVGLALAESPRADAFCSVTIEQHGPLVVPDAQLDSRFRESALVRGEPQVRFYAGFPLADSRGYRLGALCVMDREPRRLRERELRALGELAAIAGDELRRRRT